jgi:hypothetical protein
LTGGAGRAAGTLFASTDCPFTADDGLLAFPDGALLTLFVRLLFDCDCASVDVTVVLETCREPEDRRPLDEPAKAKVALLVNLLMSSTF